MSININSQQYKIIEESVQESFGTIYKLEKEYKFYIYIKRYQLLIFKKKN